MQHAGARFDDERVASPQPPLEELFTDVYVERWGPYTGSAQPDMNGGTPNLPGTKTIDTKEDLL